MKNKIIKHKYDIGQTIGFKNKNSDKRNGYIHGIKLINKNIFYILHDMINGILQEIFIQEKDVLGIIETEKIDNPKKDKETELFKILLMFLAKIKDEDINEETTGYVYKILKNNKKRTKNKFLLEGIINICNILLNKIKG